MSAVERARDPLGCTLAQYAKAKSLPVDFLKGLGVTEIRYSGVPAVRMPYRDELGKEVAVRMRTAVGKGEHGDNRFRWRRGHKPQLYGLWRLAEARARQSVVLVEGESDAQTLWSHGIAALGLPGAATWRRDWVKYFEGIATVYVVLEPDRGGDAMLKWLAFSDLRTRARLIRLDGAKDPSELHLQDPARFCERWQAAAASAVPWSDEAAALDATRKAEAWAQCEPLARNGRILDRFVEDLAATGMAGEERAAKLLYLCMTSRLLARPVSAVIKGPSSAGKSQLMGRVAQFFPTSAYIDRTAMSERALVYGHEPLEHRMLLLAEAAGVQGEVGSYLIRSLLSEGRLRYELVEKSERGIDGRFIERQGPTGVILSTTAIRLDRELETRLFSIPVSDTPEQTKNVMLAIARAGERPLEVDYVPWHSLQSWLELSGSAVSIPFAEQLARAICPVAVRLRRDFGAILTLIMAHALLHRASRELDEQERVVATLEDYDVARGLVGDLLAHEVQAAVPASVEETAAAVRMLAQGQEGVSASAVAKHLQLDRASALRRLRDAAERGYATNTETRRGRPGRWVIGEPLPDRLELLPAPEALSSGCTVAVNPGGIGTPSPLTAGEHGPASASALPPGGPFDSDAIVDSVVKAES